MGATTGGGGSGGGTAGSAGGGTGGNTASCDVANDYDAQNPPPTAWYRFENASGPVVDEAGTFDGVIDGNLSRDAVGRCGGSATFNGGRVIVPSDPSLNPGAGAGGGTTIEAWVNPTIGGNATIAARGTGNNDDNVIVGMTDCGAIQVIFSRAGASSTSLLSGCAQLTTQEWHHVAVVHDGASLTIYVDGVPAKQAAGSDLGPVDAPLVLGGRESGVFPYVGRLDEVKWWNTARSAAEVCRDAGGTFSGTCAL